MNLNQFMGASLDDRAAFVWRRGKFLAVRHWGCYEIALFTMGRYFAEIWVDRNEDRVIMIPAFKDHHCFTPYLETIELSQLFCS